MAAAASRWTIVLLEGARELCGGEARRQVVGLGVDGVLEGVERERLIVEVVPEGHAEATTELPGDVAADLAFGDVVDTLEHAPVGPLELDPLLAFGEDTRDHGQRLENENGRIFIPSVVRSAQIIDGQHRIAGLREAIKENQAIGGIEVPVSVYEHLDTPGCAAIFLSINTEQRPVARSLVIDLYGEVGQAAGDAATDRARDIVMRLNEEPESPYNGYIKLPGAPRTHGGVALSTAYTAIKPLVQDKGALDQYGINELEMQFRVILNFFCAIQEKYGDTWHSTKENAFMFAAGFTGAIEFFQTRLLPYCGKEADFTREIIGAALHMDRQSLIRPSDTTGLSGKQAISKVADLLKDRFSPKSATASTIRI